MWVANPDTGLFLSGGFVTIFTKHTEINEPPCSKLQGIRGKNLWYKNLFVLPSSKLQGIGKFK
jgi:hypothetical protein